MNRKAPILWIYVRNGALRTITKINISGSASNSKNSARRITMFKEFKEFALKGDMVDMAVGIIIGAASGTIISSLVADIIMPFGYLIKCL